MTIVLPPELLSLKNVHLDTIRGRLVESISPLSERALGTRYIFLCFTNRCGSNYLSEAIASNGVLNRAGEFFNGDTIADNARDVGLKDFGEFFNYLVGHMSKSGYLVSKIAATHLVILVTTGVLDKILERTQFIILQRCDKLGQAISLSIADQTTQWSTALPTALPDDQLAFKRDQLRRLIVGLAREYHLLDLFFGLNGIVPLLLSYENLISNADLVLAQISRFLGVDLHLEPSRINVARQTRAVNAEWREQYLAYRGV